MKKAAPSPFWLFTVFFLGLMLLPRLVTQGMFGDGLLYASLARNLAEGRGSLWAPFFSTGYFVPFASGNPYFENPPLMLWLQAGFFRLLGDFWWVEKLYALLLFLLNAWLLVRVWETPLRGTPYQGKYGWLPLLGWYLIPSVVWGNPNNLMDNNLLTFCLLALWCALDGRFSGRKVWLKLTLAGGCVYLGLMTKGPVALYPVAAPFLLALAALRRSDDYQSSERYLQLPQRSDDWKPSDRGLAAGFLQSAWMGLVAAGMFVLMLTWKQGRVLMGDIHILDETMQPVAKGQTGEIWFKTANPFEYYQDPERTAQTRSADGTMTTVGDMGYLDDDGFLYLTDRSTFMIISGGVNIYPQEIENLLVTHPKVADAAVIGAPDEEMGEKVVAVVQPLDWNDAGQALAGELTAFARASLSHVKAPRQIDFMQELPRHATGKLYKRIIRDRYWSEQKLPPSP